MTGKAAGELRHIVATLQLDRGRWLWLLLIVLLLHLVLALGDNASLLLRYDRGGIAAGGWWRLLTAHIVHLNLHHLILNELGLVLMWSLFAQDFDAVDWCIIVLSGALSISCGLWWLSPKVVWYVGASGVLHTILGAGTAKHLIEREWDRWILLLVICGKLGWEQTYGQAQPLIVVDAHLYGVTSGLLVGAALSWRIAIIRHRFSA